MGNSGLLRFLRDLGRPLRRADFDQEDLVRSDVARRDHSRDPLYANESSNLIFYGWRIFGIVVSVVKGTPWSL